MARASIETLLPLDEFSRTLGISPWEFNQIKHPKPKSAQCTEVLFQHPWQRNHLSREEVAQAIADAEQMLADELGYWPAPKYFPDEKVSYPRIWSPVGWRSTSQPLYLKWGHIVKSGVLTRTQIGTISGADLEKKDVDGDQTDDTFEATITDSAIASITDPSEIALYFEANDRLNERLDETWRIRPVKVEISGDTATIRGHLALLVRPELQAGVDADPLSASADIYVTSLECWRVYTDSSFTEENPNQGLAVWEDMPGCQSADCAQTTRPVCLGEANHEAGSVYASVGDLCPPRRPDRLRVNYLAGLALENGQMQPEMARCVTYLALSLLGSEKCGCERANHIIAYWKKRPTSFEDEMNKAVGYSKINIPFPVTRGGVYAWERVRKWRK